ncbi:unnamed protein product, partial [marine sediment metagenome]
YRKGAEWYLGGICEEFLPGAKVTHIFYLIG